MAMKDMDNKQNKVVDIISHDENEWIERQLHGMTFTKNFRSATAEEWYIFLPNDRDQESNGAAGKVLIHYNLYGNKDVFINTTIILDDPALHQSNHLNMVYSIADEIVNRLVGYADTLLSVHAGENSFMAEYIDQNE